MEIGIHRAARLSKSGSRNGIKSNAKAHKLRKTVFGLDRIIQHGIEDGYCLPVTQKFRVQAQTFKFG
jgi:hypothetical protein